LPWFWLLLAAVLLTGDVDRQAHARTEEPEAIYLCECKRTPVAPLLDGELEEEVWGRAVPVTDFVTMYQKTQGMATKRTVVRTLFDDRNLYVSLELHDDHADRIRAVHTDHDSDIYWDDSVEIFVDPTNERKVYYQLGINALGTRRDCGLVVGGGGLEYHSWWGIGVDWEAAVKRHAGGWNMEVALPLEAWGAKPEAGAMWGFQVVRFAHSDVGETSVWSPGGVYNTPERFGALVFETEVSAALRAIARAKRDQEKPGWRMVLAAGEIAFQPGQEKVAQLAASLQEALAALERDLAELPEADGQVQKIKEEKDRLALALSECLTSGPAGQGAWQEILGRLRQIEKDLDNVQWRVRLELLYRQLGW